MDIGGNTGLKDAFSRQSQAADSINQGADDTAVKRSQSICLLFLNLHYNGQVVSVSVNSTLEQMFGRSSARTGCFYKAGSTADYRELSKSIS